MLALPVKVAVVTGTSDAALLARVGELRPDALFFKPPEPDAVQQWLAS